MQINSTTRVEAIFRALLADGRAAERAELVENGVSESQILSLYPYDLAFLNDGLRAYMRAGRRITLKQTLKLHQSIEDQTWLLYDLLPYAQVVEHGKGFESRWESNSETAQLIVEYPAATFTEVDGNSRFSDPHEKQAFGFIAGLSVGLLYAQQLREVEAAGDYLQALVDTYLPDLLGD